MLTIFILASLLQYNCACYMLTFRNIFLKYSRNPEYFEERFDPVDMALIEKKIITGQYKVVAEFDHDFSKLFRILEVRNRIGFN